MKLHVNLILGSERRSCSIVTPRFIIGLSGSLLAAILVVVFGSAMISAHLHTAALESEQWAWERVQEAYTQAKPLAARRQAAETVMADLESWREVRQERHEMLSALATAVSDTLQLTELKLTCKLVVPTAPAPKARRAGEKKAPAPPPAPPPYITTDLRLSGKTSSPRADTDVARLRDAFTKYPLSNNVSSAVIPPGAFRQNPSAHAGALDRIFEIVCTYEQRTL